MGPTLLIGVGLQLLLGFIGTVTLAMAAIGVANLMIAVVNERRRELAMRRACGARRGDLLLQLLVETLVVVVCGGALGAAVGAAAVALLARMPLGGFPQPLLQESVVATTFGVLVAVGLAAGVAPARLAARVDPSAALRAR
jgi:putative ABC transport system permease protein